MRKPHVAILLSTRNGAPYLRDQLQSFGRQEYTNWSVYWRDDGSSDATAEIMAEFGRGLGAGRCFDRRDDHGQMGVTESFLHLLRHAPPDSVMAFADQDDVWLPHKLARGVAALEEAAAASPDTPALYCARQILVDEKLKPLRLSNPIRAPGFPGALTQNIATGCTIMLNPVASRIMAEARAPSDTLHDWWGYLLITAAGGLILTDDEPTVLYRQHPGNTVGAPLTPLRRALAALRRGPGKFMTTFRSHVAALDAQPEFLTDTARRAVADIAASLRHGSGRRLETLRREGLVRQSWAETQLFRIWFLIG